KTSTDDQDKSDKSDPAGAGDSTSDAATAHLISSATLVNGYRNIFSIRVLVCDICNFWTKPIFSVRLLKLPSDFQEMLEGKEEFKTYPHPVFGVPLEKLCPDDHS